MKKCANKKRNVRVYEVHIYFSFKLKLFSRSKKFLIAIYIFFLNCVIFEVLKLKTTEKSKERLSSSAGTDNAESH